MPEKHASRHVPDAAPSPGGAHAPHPEPRLDSPAIRALEAALTDRVTGTRSDTEDTDAQSQRNHRHDPDLCEAFWSGPAATTPLFEALPGPQQTNSPSHTLVTFLWRGAEERAVLAFVNGLSDRKNLAASEMRRVPGTDVWHLSYAVPEGWRGSYGFIPHIGDEPAPWAATGSETPPNLRTQRDLATYDPRCNVRCNARNGRPLSVAEHEAAPAQPWREPNTPHHPGIAQGVTELTGPDGRRCWAFDSVGIPSDPAPSDEEPPHLRAAATDPAGPEDPGVLWLVLDGEVWAEQLRFGEMMRAMTAETQRLPRIRAVLLDSGTAEQRWDELDGSSRFVNQLADAWLPWARSIFGTDFPTPSCGIAGQSLGGLTALACATEHPDAFGMASAQSSSLWLRAPRITPFAAGLTPRIRIEVGSLEPLLRTANRDFAAALTAAGADVELREFCGGHDYACWRGGLLDAIATLSLRAPSAA